MAVSNAQTASNEATAQASSVLSNVNQISPYGNVQYTQPGGPGTQWTQTTTLSPSQQALYNSMTGAEQGALTTANQQLGRVQQALGQTVTPGNIISTPSYDQNRSTFNQGQAVQGAVQGGGPITTNIGPTDFNQAASQAANAVYNQATSRLDPQWQQAQQSMQAQLTAQGLSPNSQAYQTAMQNFQQAKTDAYNQANFSAVGAGQQEQQALFNEALNQGGFANQAQAQQFAQNLGQGSFANQAAAQQYQQGMGASDFYNQAINQDFQNKLAYSQFANQAEQQAFQQQAYAQNLPINEFSALMGLGQVQGPQAQAYTPTQVAPTNVLGAYQLSTDAAQQNYQNQMAGYGSILGGLFNLGGAGILRSDRRAKTDIHEVGQRGPFKLYVFKLRGEDQWREGVMAQEVRRLRPECVLTDPEGYLVVDYERLAA